VGTGPDVGGAESWQVSYSMMDRGETSFPVRKIRPPHGTKIEVTPKASTSGDTSGVGAPHLDMSGLGEPQEPTQKYDRMRLWNESDIGWNMRNDADNEDNEEDEDDDHYVYWGVIVSEASTLSSSLQCEPSPKIPSCDVPRPTIELKHRTIGMSKYKTVQQWKTIWDAQWFELTDTAWSGQAQPPGRIVFPQRFEEAEWNAMNELYWLEPPEGTSSTLGFGSFLTLICTQASSATVSELAQLQKVLRAEHEASSMMPGSAIEIPQPICSFYHEVGHKASQCLECDNCYMFGHECYECECIFAQEL
jgi:hypothetical protein